MTNTQTRVDEIVSTQSKQLTTLQDLLQDERTQALLSSVGPGGMDPVRAATIAYTTVRYSPTLRSCTARSVVRSCVEAAKLGLWVDGVLGHAYLVPFRVRGVMEASMLVGYKGFMHLGVESGRVSRWGMDTVHEHDEYEYQEGVDVVFWHRRPKFTKEGAERGEITGAFCTAHLTAGGPPIVTMLDLSEIHARRARSSAWRAFEKAKKNGRNPNPPPWDTDFRPMAIKSAVRATSNRTPVPVLQAASARDEARDDGRAPGPSFIDLTDDEETQIEDAAEKRAACPDCGNTHLGADGRCFDCRPPSPDEGGAPDAG